MIIMLFVQESRRRERSTAPLEMHAMIDQVRKTQHLFVESTFCLLNINTFGSNHRLASAINQIFVVKKGMFLYSAVSSPLDRSKRFTLFPLPVWSVDCIFLCFSDDFVHLSSKLLNKSAVRGYKVGDTDGCLSQIHE